MTHLFDRLLALLTTIHSAFTVRDAIAAGRAPAASDLRALQIDPAIFRTINLR